MTTTLQLRDFLWRDLDNATPGTTDAKDHLGRDIGVGDVDYVGRDLIAPAWTVSAVIAVDDFVELSTGELLRATVAGTTDATTEPTAPGFGNTVVDGTVTWLQVRNA